MNKHTKTLKVRVKDRHIPLLNRMARSVNLVWNFVNELSQRSIKERGVFLSSFDFHPYTKGAGKELGLHSQTLQCIAGEYVTRRKQFKKPRLNWRKSGGVKRSLGWIPINTKAASFNLAICCLAFASSTSLKFAPPTKTPILMYCST